MAYDKQGLVNKFLEVRELRNNTLKQVKLLKGQQKAYFNTLTIMDDRGLDEAGEDKYQEIAEELRVVGRQLMLLQKLLDQQTAQLNDLHNQLRVGPIPIKKQRKVISLFNWL